MRRRHRLVERIEERIRRRRGHEHATAGRQPAAHFSQCGALVRHELESQLTQHDVERVVRQRDRFGAGFVPADRRASGRNGPRDGQHGRIQIQRGDRTARADALRREARDDTRAARNVEHAFAGTERRFRDQVLREWTSNHWNEVALVILGG